MKEQVNNVLEKSDVEWIETVSFECGGERLERATEGVGDLTKHFPDGIVLGNKTKMNEVL